MTLNVDFFDIRAYPPQEGERRQYAAPTRDDYPPASNAAGTYEGKISRMLSSINNTIREPRDGKSDSTLTGRSPSRIPFVPLKAGLTYVQRGVHYRDARPALQEKELLDEGGPMGDDGVVPPSEDKLRDDHEDRPLGVA